MIMINVEEELISMGNVEEEMYEYGKYFGRIVSMGNVVKDLYEYGKCWGRKAWVWELLWKNCMTLGNVV